MLLACGEGYWNKGYSYPEPSGYDEWESAYIEDNKLAKQSFEFLCKEECFAMSKVKKIKRGGGSVTDISEISAGYDWSKVKNSRSDNNFVHDSGKRVINRKGDTWLEFLYATDCTYDRDPESRDSDCFQFCYRGFSAKLRFEELKKFTSPFYLYSVDTEFCYYKKDEFFEELKRNGVSVSDYKQTLETALRAYWKLVRKSPESGNYYRV
jgi:hypothetical protein